MDEKTKLYVFAKKEVALIFVFMILIAITSFVFGFKVGKSYSYQSAGFTKEDRQKIDLLSDQEEQVKKIVEERGKEASSGAEQKNEKEVMEDLNKKAEQKIVEEMKALGGEEGAATAPEAQKTEQKKNEDKTTNVKAENTTPENKPAETKTAKDKDKAVNVVPPAAEKKEEKVDENLKALKKRDQYSGKFTIQLGSYRSMEEAEKFAEGFKVRGYDPIISTIKIEGQGTWYRVSLEAFDTITEAKDYIVKEKSLFLGADYVIVRFE